MTCQEQSPAKLFYKRKENVIFQINAAVKLYVSICFEMKDVLLPKGWRPGCTLQKCDAQSCTKSVGTGNHEFALKMA